MESSHIYTQNQKDQNGWAMAGGVQGKLRNKGWLGHGKRANSITGWVQLWNGTRMCVQYRFYVNDAVKFKICSVFDWGACECWCVVVNLIFGKRKEVSLRLASSHFAQPYLNC